MINMKGLNPEIWTNPKLSTTAFVNPYVHFLTAKEPRFIQTDCKDW